MIPVNTPLLDGNERKYLLECLDTGWISSEGPFVRRFEAEFAKRVERTYGVAVAACHCEIYVSRRIVDSSMRNWGGIIE
ncbi:MAG: DegT/DnrJ/EryC1/StrS family aminotransferase [Pirellulaceae bacterium]